MVVVLLDSTDLDLLEPSQFLSQEVSHNKILKLWPGLSMVQAGACPALR